jgi:hypothetical protein
LSGELANGCEALLVEDPSRKGFRDRGRGGASKGDAGPLEAGNAARLRKGLLEERLRLRPGEGRESITAKQDLVSGRIHACVCLFDGDSLGMFAKWI